MGRHDISTHPPEEFPDDRRRPPTGPEPGAEPLADEPPSPRANPAREAGRPPSAQGREWLAQLQQMIDRVAAEAAPVARDVAAKAAELAAVAGDKAGPARQARRRGDRGRRASGWRNAPSGSPTTCGPRRRRGDGAEGAFRRPPRGRGRAGRTSRRRRLTTGGRRCPTPLPRRPGATPADDRPGRGPRRRPVYSPAMSVLPILTLGDPRLRLKGEPVDSFGKLLDDLLDDLTDTMRHAPGVGLAAPQLGEALHACGRRGRGPRSSSS